MSDSAATFRPVPYAEDAPTHCPNGHELGPDRVLVGWKAPVAGSLEKGSRVHECRQCGAIVRWSPTRRWV